MSSSQIKGIGEEEGEDESNERPGDERRPKVFDGQDVEKIGEEDWLAVDGV